MHNQEKILNKIVAPQIDENGLLGCKIVAGSVFRDDRGVFIKSHAKSILSKMELESDFVESFYTISKARVLRGMHFQLPPSDHAKLVYCVSGAIMDVALDLRVDSPTFKKFQVVRLTAESGLGFYLPRGIGHGFYVIEAPAIVMYHTTSEYDRNLDAGIAWDSFGMHWPDQRPIVSQRDRDLPRLAKFHSPFKIAKV